MAMRRNGEAANRSTGEPPSDKTCGSKGSTFFALHLLLVVFSFNGVLSKIAAQHPFLSPSFLLFYGGGIALLGVYAIGWQQVIKRLPLTTAYANRAVTIIWGIVWGSLLFHEQLNAQKIAGALVVLAGVALFAWADGHQIQPESEANQ